MDLGHRCDIGRPTPESSVSPSSEIHQNVYFELSSDFRAHLDPAIQTFPEKLPNLLIGMGELASVDIHDPVFTAAKVPLGRVTRFVNGRPTNQGRRTPMG